MNMDKINLFYEVKNLFNLKDEVFEVYSILKSRTDRGRTNNTLLVFPTREIKDRNKLIIKSHTQLIEKTKDKLTDGKDIFILTTLDELLKSKYPDGIRYKEVRFLG